MTNEQRDGRLSKLHALERRGINPFPDRFDKQHTCADVVNLNGVTIDDTVSVSGRLLTIRVMGKLAFAHIHDSTGKVQLCFKKDALNERFADFKQFIDYGDFIGCTGKVFRTKTEEITVRVSNFDILAKTLREPPEKFHGVVDDRIRYSKRYLEMMSDVSVRQRFRMRSRAVTSIRSYLDRHGFEEVETPILQPNPSGANARAFKTYHEALGRDMFLRIAPETYLKRLLVGGYERVYEIGRCFRNEGTGKDHLQEFTMLEYYASWWNMWDNLTFTTGLVRGVIQDTCSTMKIMLNGIEMDFGAEWPIFEYRDLVLRDSGIDILVYNTAEALLDEIKRKNITIGDVTGLGLGSVIDKLYKAVSRPKLITPTVVVHYPAVMSPLARPNDKDPRLADQFQLLVNGWEILKGYSELVNPLTQRQNLEEQAKNRESGDDEAMIFDKPYLEAMEHGMPPNSGLGMGIDRLLSILTDQHTLKETVIFPIGS